MNLEKTKKQDAATAKEVAAAADQTTAEKNEALAKVVTKDDLIKLETRLLQAIKEMNNNAWQIDK